MWLFPPGGLRIDDGFSIHFPNWASFWNKGTGDYTPLPDFVLAADSTSLDFLDGEKEVPVTIASIQKDSTVALKRDSIIPLDSTLLKKVTQHLEFPQCEPGALDDFFASLDAAINGNGIHVAHFGDSQLEGDRMSGYFRDRLQRQFGGGGPGLVCVVPAYNQASVRQTVSSNWQRYTLFGVNEQKPAHYRYGMMGSFCRFTPLDADSTQTEPITAFCELNTTKGMYSTARSFDKLTIYYGPSQPCAIEVLEGTELLATDTLMGERGYNKLTIHLGRSAHNIRINFTGTDGPDIYGINLDTPEGVTVDNVAMRGSSGTIYTRTDFEVFSGMMRDMNTTLAIMQFGGNSVPYVKDTAECVSFGKQFYKQIMAVKKAKPGINIIVIGPSDMSYKDGDVYKTYPLLPVVVDEMRTAAHDAGAVYWDMYRAMGGAQSMPTWVSADPPLAVQDYIHFSPRGARIIAELFYDALYEQYYKYRSNKKEVM